MFKKLKNFLSNLFKKKEKEEVKQEEIVVEQKQAEEVVEVKEETPVVEEHKEEEVKKEFVFITEQDKENILNLLRPMIKSFNSDDMYKMVCEKVLESKTLKTYYEVSEDGKTLVVRLTQNKLFNEKIADFIADHVVSTFKSNIDAEVLGQYELESVNVEILIKKVK